MDAKASMYSFAKCLSHYMERHLICDGNQKTVELVIMIQVGMMVSDRQQIKEGEDVPR